MSFTPPFSIGDTVTNDDIMKVFRCGNSGGMRSAPRTKSLVVVSDYTKSLYGDRWVDDELHYTGMGRKGDQKMDRSNRILNESATNGVAVHFFEVFRFNQYIYRGLVYLSGQPFRETQDDKNGKPRQVWVFPLKLKTGSAVVDSEMLSLDSDRRQKNARKLSDEDLERRARQNDGRKASRRATTSASTAYVHDEYVTEYAKRRAKGVCQLCGCPAPFKNSKGEPFLECHHIKWLSKGGNDSIDNAVGLCPNCHRKMHVWI
jgi:5-methylcytosine-specific restriction protein A